MFLALIQCDSGADLRQMDTEMRRSGTPHRGEDAKRTLGNWDRRNGCAELGDLVRQGAKRRASANGETLGATERRSFGAGRREGRLAEGYGATGPAGSAIHDLRDPTAPREPRRPLQSIPRSMRRLLCADGRRDSSAKAQSFGARSEEHTS